MRPAAVIGLVAAVVLFAAPASSAPARAAQTGGLLAYSSEYHAAEIYLANADGGGVTRITNDQGPSRWPTLSPDGSHVPFASLRNRICRIHSPNRSPPHSTA